MDKSVLKPSSLMASVLFFANNPDRVQVVFLMDKAKFGCLQSFEGLAGISTWEEAWLWNKD